MKCPVCFTDAPLNRAGRFALHRTTPGGDYGFCPMSGQPVPISQSATPAQEAAS